MTAQTDPYVRVYYRVIDDPKFADVFDDDARLACWLRLLLVADGTWPAPAPIPANVKRGPFQHLVKVGLIDIVAGGRYRIHGMDGERGGRKEKAVAAANKRWGSNAGASSGSTANADGLASDEKMHSAPLRSAPTRSAPRQRAHDDVWSVANVLSELTGYTPSPKVIEDLRADVTNLGADRVRAAIEQAHDAGPGPFDAATLFYAAHRLLMPMTTTERLTPAERKQRERDEYLARTRAEMEAAKAAQA